MRGRTSERIPDASVQNRGASRRGWLRVRGDVGAAPRHLPPDGVAVVAGKPRMSAEQVEQAIAMRDKGYAWPYIAHRFGVSERTLRRQITALLRAREESRDG